MNGRSGESTQSAAPQSGEILASPAPRRVKLRADWIALLICTIVLLMLGSNPFWTALAVIAGLGAGQLARALSAAPLPAQLEAAREARSVTARLSAADMLQAVPDPALVVDQRGLVLHANRAATTLLPMVKLNQPLSFALRSPDVLHGIEQSLREKHPIVVDYAERVPPERSFEVTVSPILTEGDAGLSSRGAVCVLFRDATAGRRLERMRVDFVANASHELRTPLASLLGFVETLQGPARDDAPARERFLSIMREQGQRMSRLIDDLLSLSRIELNLHLQPQDRLEVTPLVRHIIDTLTPLARERGVTIFFEAPETRYFVLGDRDELLRVFENLVENAVKYGQSGERVTVKLGEILGAQEQPVAVSVAIRDHGPGIAPQHLPRLTERFYRVDVADSRGKGGTGLGLAIVKHILMRHRGRLTIESVLGDGATFTVILPLIAAEGEASSGRSHQASDPGLPAAS